MRTVAVAVRWLVADGALGRERLAVAQQDDAVQAALDDGGAHDRGHGQVASTNSAVALVSLTVPTLRICRFRLSSTARTPAGNSS